VESEWDGIQVKRGPIDHVMEFMREDLGEEGATALLAAASPDDARLLRESSLITDMVPLGVLNRLLLALASAKGEEVEVLARRVGRANGRAIRSGPYKYLLASTSAASMMRKAPVMWKLLYDHGEMVVHDLGEGKCTLRLLSFPAEPVICARISGMTEGYLEAIGTQEVLATHVCCRDRGDAVCEWEVRWRDDSD
jgi:predicted hydrocarbon binding protein